MSFAAAGVAAAADATTNAVEGKAGVKPGSVDYPLDPVQGQREPAARITLTISGNTVDAYCIDLNHPLASGGTYQETGWVPSAVNNLGKVQWILVHSFPNVTSADVLKAANQPASGDADQIVYAGTQAAIWHFSDGFNLGDYKGGNPAVKATYPAVQGVYDYLLKNAVDTNEPAPTLSITPPDATGELGSKVGPYTVNTSSKATLTANGGKIVDADGNEVSSLTNGGKFWLTSDTAGKVTVDAKAVGTVPTGRVFTYTKAPKEAQKIILAGKVTTNLTAHASGTFIPKAAPAPATPSLPVTGASAIGAAIGGIALLVAGGVLVLLLRRRRVKFTA